MTEKVEHIVAELQQKGFKMTTQEFCATRVFNAVVLTGLGNFIQA
ncbi:MAG: hypothetical protein V1735_00450 [Nanoarchaeota archaeon]